MAGPLFRRLDISGHRSSSLSAYLIGESDLIFALAHSHERTITGLAPHAAEKCLLLAEQDIADPIGQPQQVYDECAGRIAEAVEKQLSEWKL